MPVNVTAGTSNVNVNSRQGWMLFVRGSRSTNLSQAASAVANPTVLRTKGTINTGTKTVSSLVSGFNVIGNPYPSTINFKNLVLNTVNDTYYLWDPNIPGANQVGGYVTFSGDGSHNGVYVKSVSSGSAGNIPGDGTIQSGSAFLVKSTSGSGSITFNEVNKDTGSSNLQFRPVILTNQLRTTLYAIEPGTGNLLLNDGNVICYNKRYSDAFDNVDAEKPNNFAENFGIISNGKKLSIERRSFLKNTDTVFYEMWKMRVRNYLLEFVFDDVIAPAGTAAFLEDSYLQTKTPVSLHDTTRVSFSITNDAGSAVSNRFRLVFNPSVTFDNINAVIVNNDVKVTWGTNREFNILDYDIEKSDDGIDFIKQATKNAIFNNNQSALYNWLDIAPAPGKTYYYRIKSRSNTGVVAFSRVVSVTFIKNTPSVFIYPNPIAGNAIQLQMLGMPADVYDIRLINSLGQLLYSATFKHNSITSSEKIVLDKKYPAGTYRLLLRGGNKKEFILNLIVE